MVKCYHHTTPPNAGRAPRPNETGEKKKGLRTVSKTDFFLPMIPPTKTAQEKKIVVKNGKPFFYEPQELKNVRQKFLDHLAEHKPAKCFDGAIELLVKWCFWTSGKNKHGKWKTSKPDTDNLQKMFKDCMTKLNFWKDDAQVCREIVEKFYSDVPGIYVRITEMENDGYG